jgi:MerR family transcriptional regulator, light-induced transcriptional regulator
MLGPSSRDQSADRSEQLLRDVAEPSRRQLLALMLDGPKSVSQLVEATGMKQPNVSNHLARLRDSGVVRANKVGRQVFYAITDPGVRETLQSFIGEDSFSWSSVQLDEATLSAFCASALAGAEGPCAAVVDALLREGRPLVELYEGLFTAALVRTGELYEAGEADEAQEHAASAIIERLMARALFHAPPLTPNAGKVVVGCPPGNWHSIGARMVSDALRIRGWNTVYLGANVPEASFVAAVKSHNPSVVVVSCSFEDAVPAALQLVRALHALRPGLPFRLAAGGRAVEPHGPEFRRAGAELVGASLAEIQHWASEV